MKPVLRPGAALVRRDAEHLQIGTAPGAASVVREQPGMLDVLRTFDGVRDVDGVASELGGSARADPEPLVRALHAAHVVLDADAWLGQPTEALRSEARHLAARGVDARSIEHRMRRREAARIEIGFDADTRGLAERTAVLLHESGIDASLAPVKEPSLVLVLSVGPCPRDTFDVLADARVAHLPVCFDEDRIRVGPLVRPGLTPCVTCDDRQRALWDTAWPALLAQVARPLAWPAHGMSHAMSAVLVGAAAAVVASEAVATSEGSDTRTEHAVMTLGPEPYDQQVQPVPFAAACGCQILATTQSVALTTSPRRTRATERV